MENNSQYYGYTVTIEDIFGHTEENEEYWFPTLEGAYAFAVHVAVEDGPPGYYIPAVYDEAASAFLTGWQDHARAHEAMRIADLYQRTAHSDPDFFPVVEVSA